MHHPKTTPSANPTPRPTASKAAGIRKTVTIILDPERMEMYRSDAVFCRALAENLSEEFPSADEILISDGVITVAKFRPEAYLDGEPTQRVVVQAPPKAKNLPDLMGRIPRATVRG